MWCNKGPTWCREDPTCQLRPVAAKNKQTNKQTVGGSIIAPKDVHVLMSQTWRSYLPWQDSSRCGYVRALKMGEIILDYVGECSVSLRFLKRCEREAEDQSQRGFWSSCSTDFEKGKGPWAKECSNLPLVSASLHFYLLYSTSLPSP